MSSSSEYSLICATFHKVLTLLLTSVSEVFGFPVGNVHGKPANLAGVPRRQARVAGRMPKRQTVLCSDATLRGAQWDGKGRRGVSEYPQGMPEANRRIVELSKQITAADAASLFGWFFMFAVAARRILLVRGPFPGERDDA